MQVPAAVPSSLEFQVPGGPGAHLSSASLWLHLLAPLAGMGLLLAWAGPLGGDQLLADQVYAWEGHSWALRNAWLTDTVIHVLGRNLNAAIWVVLALAWALASLLSREWSLRRPLGYLVLATLASCLAVSWIKSWSNMDCPWDLLRYGGHREFIGLLEVRPLGMGRGRCFPAGHASGGYAWVALYFFCLAAAPRWRWVGLSLGMASGLIFGISQQLRGAHFLSHDLYTAGICWLIAIVLYVGILRSSGERGDSQFNEGDSR